MANSESTDDKPDFSGHYDHFHSEFFADFLKVLGANYVVRHIAAKTEPSYMIYHHGNIMRIIFSYAFTRREKFLEIGSEREDADWLGSRSKVQVYWDGSQIVEKYSPLEANGKPMKVAMELMGTDTLIFKMEADGVFCQRFFRKRRRVFMDDF